MTDRELQMCLYAYNNASMYLVKHKDKHSGNQLEKFQDFCFYIVRILQQRKKENTQIGKGLPNNHKLYNKLIKEIIPTYITFSF